MRSLTKMGLNNVGIIECRMLLAAIILVVSLFCFQKELLKFRWKDIWIFIGAGASGSLILNLFINIAIVNLSLSFATVLLSTMPVYVIFLASLLFKESITKLKLICVGLMFLGCILVSNIFLGNSNISVLGIICGLLAGFSYALYSIFTRVGLNKGYHPVTIATYSIVISAAILLFFTDWNQIFNVIQVAPVHRTGLLIIQSIVSIVAPYSLYNIALKYIDTGIASILSSVEPVAATFFGFMIFGEQPTIFSIIGLLIVLFALALLSNPFSLKNENTEAETANE